LITRLAALSGATRIVATDRLPHRLAVARDMGATAALEVTGERVGDAVHDLAGGGVDVAYEVAGDNDAIEDAFDAARPGGTVVIIGVPREDRISVLASVARFKELHVVFSQRMKHTYDRAIELAASGRIALGPLVTHRFPLEQAPAALEFARGRSGVKVVVEP
jgi:L-iditol 2-dehydrogenase